MHRVSRSANILFLHSSLLSSPITNMSKRCNRVKMFNNCFSLSSLSVLVRGASRYTGAFRYVNDKTNGKDIKLSKRQKFAYRKRGLEGGGRGEKWEKICMRRLRAINIRVVHGYGSLWDSDRNRSICRRNIAFHNFN
ncbi:unnamed protein product [Lasius platythorax]|uniref:Uncharacterized protein n=1 Tax=Lasius platythorax TaxID=488582 RepID=A0AAV2NSI4_9HYME